jgi:hypothetical protein
MSVLLATDSVDGVAQQLRDMELVEHDLLVWSLERRRSCRDVRPPHVHRQRLDLGKPFWWRRFEELGQRLPLASVYKEVCTWSSSRERRP